MIAHSLYDIAIEEGTNILNTGFDYTINGRMLTRTISPYLFQNVNMNEFLGAVADAFAVNVETVKKIRIHNNYSVNKSYKKIN